MFDWFCCCTFHFIWKWIWHTFLAAAGL
jgi:hypothetical protein